VVRNWDQIKREDERGGEPFGHIPETLPATLYAKKVLRRARSAGLDPDPGSDDGPGARLLEAVREAVEAGADPELALREAAERYRKRIESP
jgi:XTP/dITP diphosphohydrolase